MMLSFACSFLLSTVSIGWVSAASDLQLQAGTVQHTLHRCEVGLVLEAASACVHGVPLVKYRRQCSAIRMHPWSEGWCFCKAIHSAHDALHFPYSALVHHCILHLVFRALAS